MSFPPLVIPDPVPGGNLPFFYKTFFAFLEM